MRRRLALIATALALLAAPAAGQDKGRITVIQPAPKAGLRPSQTADLDALGLTGAQRRAAADLPPPVLSAPPAPVRPDAGRCRINCAQTYYFCAAADAPEDCAPAWAQCRAGCEPSSSWRTPIGFGSGG